MQTKTPPYNTGKIKIGLTYEAPRHSNMSDDESHLQNVLLGLHDNTQVQREKLAWGVIFFLAILLLLVVYAPR
jgi:hypothetical protein